MSSCVSVLSGITLALPSIKVVKKISIVRYQNVVIPDRGLFVMVAESSTKVPISDDGVCGGDLDGS